MKTRSDHLIKLLSCLLIIGMTSQAVAAQDGTTKATRSAPEQTVVDRANGAEVRVLLVPRTESQFASPITAQITELKVHDGDRFKKGDVLVRFSCGENKAELNKARAELNSAQKTYESNLKLLQHKAINSLEVEVSKANVARARAQVDLMRARVRNCSVVAPYDGRVARLEVHPYSSVSQGQPLLETIDDSVLRMELYVPSRWLSWLAPDQSFTVTIDETGKTYPARITAIGARVDPVSQTVPVYGEIVGRFDELLAGMSGIAQLETQAE